MKVLTFKKDKGYGLKPVLRQRARQERGSVASVLRGERNYTQARKVVFTLTHKTIWLDEALRDFAEENDVSMSNACKLLVFEWLKEVSKN